MSSRLARGQNLDVGCPFFAKGMTLGMVVTKAMEVYAWIRVWSSDNTSAPEARSPVLSFPVRLTDFDVVSVVRTSPVSHVAGVE